MNKKLSDYDFGRVKLDDLPEGTIMIPACSIEEGAEGWIILPAEDEMDPESFKKWKDQVMDLAINRGLRELKESKGES